MDSAIAALFCIGLYNMHSAGVGGGGFMVAYKKSTRFVEVIDFREEAPGKASRTMYVGGAMSSTNGTQHSLLKTSLLVKFQTSTRGRLQCGFWASPLKGSIVLIGAFVDSRTLDSLILILFVSTSCVCHLERSNQFGRRGGLKASALNFG